MVSVGMVKQGRGSVIGNAGEYFVVAELLRRDVIAALAPRNTPNLDILATSGSRSVVIRVKTKTAAADSWVWMARADGSILRDITNDDFTVCVDLDTPDEPVKYHVFRTQELDEALKRDFETWLSTPGRGGRPHSQANPQRRLGYWGDTYPKLLQDSSNRWDIIIDRL